ncbi:MAG: hypothetical protein KHZ01_12080, partial [Lachnospiraceae bacterium]|nr:hypothetical protein [Lachnospiraceae bacterium]
EAQGGGADPGNAFGHSPVQIQPLHEKASEYPEIPRRLKGCPEHMPGIGRVFGKILPGKIFKKVLLGKIFKKVLDEN